MLKKINIITFHNRWSGLLKPEFLFFFVCLNIVDSFLLTHFFYFVFTIQFLNFILSVSVHVSNEVILIDYYNSLIDLDVSTIAVYFSLLLMLFALENQTQSNIDIMLNKFKNIMIWYFVHIAQL